MKIYHLTSHKHSEDPMNCPNCGETSIMKIISTGKHEIEFAENDFDRKQRAVEFGEYRFGIFLCPLCNDFFVLEKTSFSVDDEIERIDSVGGPSWRSIYSERLLYPHITEPPKNNELRTKLLSLAEEIESTETLMPEYDPILADSIYEGFYRKLQQFVFSARNIYDTELQDLIDEIRSEIKSEKPQLHKIKTYVSLAKELINELEITIKQKVTNYQNVISNEVISELHILKDKPNKFDITKLLQISLEMNNSYQNENYIAVSLLVKALMNHIPPIFGQIEFKQVASQATRSRKAHFESLQKQFRAVADLHTHDVIRSKEFPVTKTQIDPFLPALEILLQETVTELNKNE